MRLVRLLQREQPDVVHTFLIAASIYGRMAAFAAGVPLVLAAEQNVYEQKPRRHALLERVLASPDLPRRRLLRGGRAILPATGRACPASKVAVVYNAVRFGRRPDRPTRVTARAALGLPADALVLGTLGRLTEQKGHGVLLRARRRSWRSRSRTSTCSWPATGPLRDDPRSRGRRLGIADRVRFLGLRRDRETLYAAMDVFVLPSHWEGLSLALVEAMGAGASGRGDRRGRQPGGRRRTARPACWCRPAIPPPWPSARLSWPDDRLERSASGGCRRDDARARFSHRAARERQLAALYRQGLAERTRQTGLARSARMSGPRVTIVNYTLSMMRGGGETRDLAFATHLRASAATSRWSRSIRCSGRVRHPIQGVPSRLLRAPYFRDLVYRLMVLPEDGPARDVPAEPGLQAVQPARDRPGRGPGLPDRHSPGGRSLSRGRGEAAARSPGGHSQSGRAARQAGCARTCRRLTRSSGTAGTRSTSSRRWAAS